MRRAGLTIIAILMVAFLSPPAWAVLPPETASTNQQLAGVGARSIVIVGNLVWVAGDLTTAKVGAQSRTIKEVASFTKSGGFGPTSPALTGIVYKLVLDPDGWMYAAGSFTHSSGAKNLLRFNPATGAVDTTFKPANVQSLKALEVGSLIYAGGTRLTAYRFNGTKETAFKASSLTTPTPRTHAIAPAYRDLELGTDGWLYGACQCDVLSQSGRARNVKALVRLHPTNGTHDETFRPLPNDDSDAFGHQVVPSSSGVYFAAGGSDFVARFLSGNDWQTDTSGSAQGLALTADGQELIVGGHFEWASHNLQCGSNQNPTGVCERRDRIMALDQGTGQLLSWNPQLSPLKYAGVWDVVVDGSSVHIAGEFNSVAGVAHKYYARLG